MQICTYLRMYLFLSSYICLFRSLRYYCLSWVCMYCLGPQIIPTHIHTHTDTHRYTHTYIYIYIYIYISLLLTSYIHSLVDALLAAIIVLILTYFSFIIHETFYAWTYGYMHGQYSQKCLKNVLRSFIWIVARYLESNLNTLSWYVVDNALSKK